MKEVKLRLRAQSCCCGDEALVGEPVAPRFVARPQTAEQVAALLAAATRAQMPVTARGSGTGLSAAARPCPNGLLISLERMSAGAYLIIAAMFGGGVAKRTGGTVFLAGDPAPEKIKREE